MPAEVHELQLFQRHVLSDNTPMIERSVLNEEYSIYQDFTNGQCVRKREDEESQLEQGKLCGLPLEKTAYLKYGITATTVNEALEHQHIIYCLRFLNIRESGVTVY